MTAAEVDSRLSICRPLQSTHVHMQSPQYSYAGGRTETVAGPRGGCSDGFGTMLVLAEGGLQRVSSGVGSAGRCPGELPGNGAA